ncbi:MAG TPA: magnesium chelatase ATPase subunit I [Pyrinomonadaceae bacterium]|nr:magnesium chelatase ATPase subunit I [Pyrinomonadaceae bacterium]
MAGHSANNNKRAQLSAARPVFPFTAIVGQEEMKLALLLNVIAPIVGGVLVMGHRGTAKSTAVRALASLLPPLKVVRGCAFNCDPADTSDLCDECLARLEESGKLRGEPRAVPVVELPLGATEDRVCGTIDLGRALREGIKSFEPGLLAEANRGFLYIDEVNLLEDHLVDLLLDVAATSRNRVEREGVSAEHPSRFVLVGSGNPEEGELRPQLLDRFGLSVEVETVRDIESRVLIVEHREAFDSDPLKFLDAHKDEQARLRSRILKAARIFPKVEVPRTLLNSIAELCIRLGVDGHRGEITITRAARALAAFEGRRKATAEDVRRVAAMSLRHRLRRDPFEQSGGGARIENSVEELFGDSRASVDARMNSDESQRAEARPSGRAFSDRRCDALPDGRASASRLDGEQTVAPTSEVSLKQHLLAHQAETKQRTGRASQTARRAGLRSSSYATRGRHVGAATQRTTRALAPDATLRAAALAQARRRSETKDFALSLAPEDLRFKRFRAKAGALYIFLIDTSGSMAANRISQAKGALAGLLRRSYLSRDRVSLISFRERDATLLLAPSASATRARKLLDELPVGGATPLAAGLLRALDISRRASVERARRTNLVVFTDGRANLPLSENLSKDSTTLKNQIRDEIRRIGSSLRGEGVASLVIDTQQRFTSNGEGEFLSEALGGRYVRLPQLISETSLMEALGDSSA